MKRWDDKCDKSQSGWHSFFPEKYTRDDSCFYCKCVSCNEDIYFEADTLEDFYSYFDDFSDDDD